MRLTTVGGTLVERFLLAVGAVPTPLLDTFIALMLARTVMVAARFNVLEALSEGSLTAAEVAERCGTDAGATGNLLTALAGARYVRVGSDGRYRLAPVAKRWMLACARVSMRDAVLHRYLDARFMEHADEYLRTGEPVDFHRPGMMTSQEWEIYLRGQRADAAYCASEVARRMPMPKRPVAMLDIGGGHGHYSAALCRRHPQLRATVLDLPQAADYARALLEREGVGDRVCYRCGDVASEDLGQELYDLILVAHVVHHFSDSTNRDLMRRMAAALKRGGYCVVLDIERERSAQSAGQTGALTNLYFAITSGGGTRSLEEIASWQREAGLRVCKPIHLRFAPGIGMQAACRES